MREVVVITMVVIAKAILTMLIFAFAVAMLLNGDLFFGFGTSLLVVLWVVDFTYGVVDIARN